MPIVLRLLLDNLGRRESDPKRLAEIAARLVGGTTTELELSPNRIILPDSSGLPLLMDLAALRDWAESRGMDPTLVEPQLPVDLIIDHSLIVEHAGSPDAAKLNLAIEYRRNRERYAFLKWAGEAFEKLRIVPPGKGIIHQINLERLARIAVPSATDPSRMQPEFVLGCDSHTSMINALGMLGWGVGGIEAEAALIGLPYHLTASGITGVRLVGSLSDMATATDLVLRITRDLRRLGVSGDLVEFFGPGVQGLSVFDRATIANMAPEYGATTGFFAYDRQTRDFLAITGREARHVARVDDYMRRAGFAADPGYSPVFGKSLEIDLGSVEPAIAGPAKPQDLIALSAAPATCGTGSALAPGDGLRDGSIVLAAITSCTNTAHPASVIAAAVLARNAARRGLRIKPWVKTSFAPGSQVVDRYLGELGLQDGLDALGFQIVGHACTTCSGKSGPLDPEVSRAIADRGLDVVSVLSGNRNFPGRIHKSTRSNYIMSPALVVAYALAGRIDFDFATDSLGTGDDGQPILLEHLWPGRGEIDALVGSSQSPRLYDEVYAALDKGDAFWSDLAHAPSASFAWDEGSEYLKCPPFVTGRPRPLENLIAAARVLVFVGDDLTTDQITPSGEILPDSAAGRYLTDRGIARGDFNAVTQRRGNHEVMKRVTFASQRFENIMANGTIGGVTRIGADAPLMPVHQAADILAGRDLPAVVLAGARYGTGSSRDWAAKGPWMLGVRVVLAGSIERIHRKNLICMGIVPLIFDAGASAQSLGLSGLEVYRFDGLLDACASGTPVRVTATDQGGKVKSFDAKLDIAGQSDAEILKAGGIFEVMKARLEGIGKGI